MKRIAAIGDPHACAEELKELLSHLAWLSLDEIWSLGDNVDRGPDNAATLALLREKGVNSIFGNHEESVLRLYDRTLRGEDAPSNPDKARTLRELTAPDWEYIRQSPRIKVFDDLKVVLVHAGVWPWISFDKQPKNVVRCQMVHTSKPDQTRWFGKDADKHKSGKNEDQNRLEGWHRWYELYNHDYDCYFGHSVFQQPMIRQNPGFGRTVGIDTGSCFGGSLTAAIIGDKTPWFVSVKSKRPYVESFKIPQE